MLGSSLGEENIMLIQECNLGRTKPTPKPNFYGPFVRDPPIVPVILVGESKVGKTSIARHFRKERFSEKYEPHFGLKKSQIMVDQPCDLCDDKLIVRFLETNDVFMDPEHTLSLQDRVDSLHASLSRYIVVVYDITDHSTFEAVKDWVLLMRNNLVRTDVSMILVGNKTDQTKQREVHRTAGEVFAILNDMRFIETSAKDGNNLHKLFSYILPPCHDKKTDHENETGRAEEERVKGGEKR